MEYIHNKETDKLELHFSKEEYMALPDESKSEIKHNFLFSRSAGAWVSSAKWPNFGYAKRVAEKLGAVDGGKVGDRLSFGEQQERKAERAEARADRMEEYAENAEKRGRELQKPFDAVRGDIAFMTQPVINTSAGRAFANRRKKIFDAYDRGFEEFKKSEYFRERAETARATAQQSRPTDKAFITRRIEDAQKNIRAQRKNIDHYEAQLEKLDNGVALYGWDRKPIERDTVVGWIENAEEIIEANISKEIYYRDCLEAAGGVNFSKENVHKGDLINCGKWGKVKVERCGPKNVTFSFLEKHMTYADGSPMLGQISYADIKEVISAAG